MFDSSLTVGVLIFACAALSWYLTLHRLIPLVGEVWDRGWGGVFWRGAQGGS